MSGLTRLSVDRGRSLARDDDGWATSVAHLLRIALEEIDADRRAATAAIAKAHALLSVRLDRAPQLDRGLPVLPQSSASGGLMKWQVRRVLRFIEEHMDEPIRVATLSELAGLSGTYFSCSFKRTFGEPPHAYLTRLRVKHACSLMLFGELTLSEVAQACGFADQAHFSRRFRERTGRSPAAWRREHWDEHARSADAASAQSPPVGGQAAGRARLRSDEEQARAAG